MRACAVLFLALLTFLPHSDVASPPPEVVADWLAQDGVTDLKSVSKQTVRAVLNELGAGGADLQAPLGKVKDEDSAAIADLYLKACEKRRLARLAPYIEKVKRVVFTKHFDMGGSHYAYTEGQSDAQNERHFVPGASLCVLEMDGIYGRIRTLLDDPKGVIRDPDVSYDGQRILFAWKKSLNEDDYHLYEMNVADGKARQLTFGLGFADYEGAYLPNGDIIFNSSRCVQIVDCWWTEVSNLYTCDGDGRFLRRLTFDQVHTNFPTVTPDGRLVYTRWDYNDRGQIYPQGLFQMYPDGTAQSELYGNNSWFPTTLLHARAIPGTGKYVAIFTGHHTRQKGWLGIIDPAKGRQENSGAQLIAPVRDTPAVRIDAYGQSGDQFQYPYPLEPTRKDVMLNAVKHLNGEILRSAQNDKGLGETAFLVTLKPEKSPRFAIYFVTMDGKRELLASDPKISCNQPVPLAPRPRPHVRPSMVDYRQNTATFYVQDVYGGEGLKGVPRGAIKNIRVVALEYRAAGVGHNGNSGPAGGALISTPVSIQGTWDVKKVLGTAKVYEDGSAYFTVPARTPVYFQALNAKGHAVQTMRSWVTLQPSERRGCVGCHDNENAAPPITRASIALQHGAQPLERESWQKEDTPRGFSFIREVQPILDKHCVRCHNVDVPPTYAKARKSSEPPTATGVQPAFSLKGKQTLDVNSRRKWSDSYLALAHRGIADWINVQSEPSPLPPYHAGATKSRLISMLEEGYYGVKLSREELDCIACWIDLLVPYCGDYTEAMDESVLPRYLHFLNKRKRMEEQEAKNIQEFIRRY